jgi:two-component system NtrC family sensor kinase
LLSLLIMEGPEQSGRACPIHRCLQHDETASAQARAQADAQEFTTAVTSGIGLLLLALALLALVTWRRAYRPLRGLSALIGRLARQDYWPHPLGGVDPVVRPIFASYNQLVSRLSDLQEAHQARHDQMERQVREAAGALISQRAELARVERLAALGELAASLAHELRNPLAGIRAACRSLLEDVSDLDTGDRLRLIAEEVDRLVDLVKEQLGRARHEPERVADVDLAPLVGSIVALVGYQMPANVSLIVEMPPTLRARVPRNGFRQALLNLLRNAQRAVTGCGGLVRVSGGARGREVEICVEDSGPGFSDSHLRDGIRRFATTWDGGTGLGLAMVQRFAQEVGGRFELENREEGGARACILIPGAASLEDA